jgi:hypothetical protein
MRQLPLHTAATTIATTFGATAMQGCLRGRHRPPKNRRLWVLNGSLRAAHSYRSLTEMSTVAPQSPLPSARAFLAVSDLEFPSLYDAEVEAGA